MNINNFDYQFTICLVGDSNVGKSTIAVQLGKGIFLTRHNDTIQQFTYRYERLDKKVIEFQIIDTSGKEPYRSLAWSYYRNCAAIFIIFDINRRDSYDNLRKWYEEISHYAKEYKLLFLIGNKSDLQQIVQFEEGEQFAETHNMQYFQVTATNIIGDLRSIKLDALMKQIGAILTKIVDEDPKKIKNGVLIGRTNTNIIQPYQKQRQSCCTIY
ncbi:hypothetical protein pb186bvf_013856 [Paramecium bursaria]